MISHGAWAEDANRRPMLPEPCLPTRCRPESAMRAGVNIHDVHA